MKGRTLIFALLTIYLSGAMAVTACRRPPLNPNGDSELAILMRDMHQDAEAMREQIARGRRVRSGINASRLLSATPTQKGKTETPEYIQWPKVYGEALARLENAAEEEAPIMYTGLVNTCVNCHRSMCPGPVVLIEKLHLEASLPDGPVRSD